MRWPKVEAAEAAVVLVVVELVAAELAGELRRALVGVGSPVGAIGLPLR